jgi:RTX calcium-binding nonapeptide repeat (4 copies)
MRRLLVPALFVAMGLTGIQAAGAAIVRGTPGPDLLRGTAFADELYGRGGADRLEGRDGDDLLDGGPGRDRLFGGAGADWFASSGDERSDTVRCGPGLDVVNADLTDPVAADCDVVSRRLSRDVDRVSAANHETQVEPDSHAFGSTIVTVFQSGRFVEGGAATIGFATSRNGGRTWRSGFLPSLSVYSKPPGPSSSISDPVVAYDAAHRWWLASSLSTAAILVSRSRDGVSWNRPVTAAPDPTGELDKEWLTCDNWPRSRFRGRCYLSYMNFELNLLETRRSTDGGRTWSRPVAFNAGRPAAVVNGVQPVVRPNGDLLLVFTVFAAGPFAGEIAATRSTDGGQSFAALSRVAPLQPADPIWMRAPSFASVDVDAAGTVYVAWSDGCFTDECTAHIVLARSPDGISWSPHASVPITPSNRPPDHFLPGLAVDPATAGASARVALLYHSIGPPVYCDPTSGCSAIDVGLVTSRDGGRTWGRTQRLNVVSMSPFWMAETSLGRMLGDYVSVSWLRGRPVPVYSLATAPSAGLLRQAIFAGTRLPLTTARR